MSRSKILSEKSKNRLAGELGIKDKVVKDGWGEATSKDCGNIVKKAIDSAIGDEKK